MDNGGLNLLLAVAGLILLVLATTLVGLFFLGRYLQRAMQEELKALRRDLRQLHSERRQIIYRAQAYSPDEAEPYGPAAQALFDHLERSAAQMEALEYAVVRIQERLHSLAGNTLRLAFGAPFFWLELRSQASQARLVLEQMRQSLREMAPWEEKLRLAGWQVALQVREAQKIQVQLAQRMQRLQGLSLRGPEFEKASQQQAHLQAELAHLPPIFLEADQEMLLQQADHASVISAHQVLASAAPLLKQLAEQAQTWEKGIAEAEDRLAVMRRVLDELGQTLSVLPAELDAAAFEQQYKGLGIIAQNLEATFARLEVDSLQLVSQEAWRVMQSAQELGSQVKRARRDLSALQSLLPDMDVRFKELSLKFATLGARSTYPILWSSSLDQLADLHRQANALGTVAQKRTPAGVQEAMKQAAQINARQKELASQFQAVEQSYTDLLTLLSGPELSQLKSWVESAERTIAHAQTYAPENWGRGEHPDSLADEVNELAQGLQRWLPAEKTGTIPEDEIQSRAAQLRQLIQAGQKAQARYDQMRLRLERLQRLEQQAQQEIQSTQETLSALVFLARSNTLLDRTAGLGIGQMQRELPALQNEIEQRQRGGVQSKASRAKALAARLEQSANRWLDDINKDLRSLVKELAADLTELEEIAAFDEPAVKVSRDLLAEWQTFEPGVQGRSQMRLQEASAELKRRSDYWQRCSAARAALRDVLQPVSESQQHIVQVRQATMKHLAEAEGLLRQDGGWPPVSSGLESERQELDRLETQRQQLSSRPQRALQFVQQLGSLAGKYQSLADKIRQRIDTITQEKHKIQSCMSEITGLLASWERLRDQYGDNPTTSQEISEMLSKANQKLNQIQGQARRGARGYNQVLQELNDVQRTLQHFQAYLDDDHAVDSDGWVRTRR